MNIKAWLEEWGLIPLACNPKTHESKYYFSWKKTLPNGWRWF